MTTVSMQQHSHLTASDCLSPPQPPPEQLNNLKRFDSITLRVTAVLLLGLLAAQWVSERLYQEERKRVVSHLIAGPLGQRLSQVARKLEHTPAAERGELLQILNSPRITFALPATPGADTELPECEKLGSPSGGRSGATTFLQRQEKGMRQKRVVARQMAS
jgi:hypothetical protein